MGGVSGILYCIVYCIGVLDMPPLGYWGIGVLGIGVLGYLVLGIGVLGIGWGGGRKASIQKC